MQDHGGHGDAETVAIPFYIVDGIITDRYGHKPAMVCGVCFTAALVRFERRAEAYSITRVAVHVGMIAGPLAAAVLIARDPSYRTLFLTGAAICVAFVFIVVLGFHETRPEALLAESSLGETVRVYGHVLRDRRFLTFCAVALLPLYGFGQIWTILPVLLRNAQGMPASTWGYVVAFYAVGVAVFQYPVIRWLRQKDHVLLMAASSALLGPTFGGMAMDGLGEHGPALVVMACGSAGAVSYVAVARSFRLADATEATQTAVDDAPPVGSLGA